MDFKKYIEEKNISLLSLSKKADIPYSTLFDLYSNKRDVSSSKAITILKLSKALGVTMEELIIDNSKYSDKYKLNRKESEFLLKKNWDESIYIGMKMENRDVTFPETKAILDGINVPNVNINDIEAILNMRDAYRYLKDTLDYDLSLEYILKINSFVSRNESLSWGMLRTGNVGISGTDYKPIVPKEEDVRNNLLHMLNKNCSKTELALNLFSYLTRAQLFWDGNKRTALIIANKIMLQHGLGFISIKDSNILTFNKELLYYYDTGNKEKLLDFLYNNCIVGID